MKKVLSIMAVAAVMLFASKANAQLSIHAGYQDFRTEQKVTVLGASSTSTGSDGGFYIGGSYNMEAGGGLAVAPGVYFAYVENAMDIRVPILLNYTLHINKLGIGAFVGPNINYGIGGDLYETSSTASLEVNRFDLGLTFGGQLSYNNISLEIGYNMGLLNRWKDAPSDCYIKANQFFVGLGYSL